MTWASLARIHRLHVMVAGALLLTALGCVAVRWPAGLGDLSRSVRVGVIAFAPAVLGVATLRPVPDLAGTTVRDARLAAALNVATALASAIVAGCLWVQERPSAGRVAYDATTLAALLSLMLFLTRRFDAAGLIAAALGGMVAILYDNSLGNALGFGGLDHGFADGPRMTDLGWLCFGVAMACLCWAAVIDPVRSRSVA